MNRENGIRYFIEHQLTRNWFFQDGLQFTSVLTERREIYPAMVRQVYQENGAECPFTDDMFTIAALHLEGDVFCLSIRMPEPEQEGDCLQILMIYTGSFSRRAYYTIEYGESLFSGQKLTWCCEWSEEGEHRSWGQCSPEPLECLRKCCELFCEKE